MALQKAKPCELPGDAVVLNEKQAIRYYMNLVKNWGNKSDVFFIRYGVFILGGANFIAGMYINNVFRTKLRLFNYGRMSSYLPTCCIPAVFGGALHAEFILSDLILMKTECPVCVEMRASAMQSVIGFAFPMIMAPVSCLALAHKYGTYDIPYITKKPMEVFNLLRKFILPTKNLLFAIFIGQALLGSVVTYLEAKSIFTINSDLLKLEENVEKKLL